MNQSAFIEKFTLLPTQSGPLSGLSFAVKDFIDVQHYVTGCGNLVWKSSHEKAEKNADCVDKLLLAGAQCLGKTVCDEMGFSLSGKNFFYADGPFILKFFRP